MKSLTLLLLLFVSAVVNAKTVYVSGASGSDANNGLSAGTAKESIQAGANLLVPGDILEIVGPHTYYERPILANLGTSAANPVYIIANPRGSVTISGNWEEAAEGRNCVGS